MLSGFTLNSLTWYFFLIRLNFPGLKKAKNCIKEQTLTGNNKKLSSPKCNTRLTETIKLEGKKKTKGKKKKFKPSPLSFLHAKNTDSKRSAVTEICLLWEVQLWASRDEGGSPIFITSFSLQRTVSAKHVKRLYVRVSYIASYAAMGETELLFEKTYFPSLKAILLEIVSGSLFYS